MPRSPDGGRMRPGSPNGNCKWADTEWAQAAQLDWVHFSFEEAPQLLETEHFILTTRRKSFCPLSFFCKISQRSMVTWWEAVGFTDVIIARLLDNMQWWGQKSGRSEVAGKVYFLSHSAIVCHSFPFFLSHPAIVRHPNPQFPCRVAPCFNIVATMMSASNLPYRCPKMGTRGVGQRCLDCLNCNK